MQEKLAVPVVAKDFGAIGVRRGEGRDSIAVFQALLQIAAENEFMEESDVESPLPCKDRKRGQKQQKKAVYRGGSPILRPRFCRGILEPRAGLEPATCRLVREVHVVGSLGFVVRPTPWFWSVFGIYWTQDGFDFF